MKNNEVRDRRGKIIGFQRSTCFNIFPSMWGETCNQCRETERRHQELIGALQKMSEGSNG